MAFLKFEVRNDTAINKIVRSINAGNKHIKAMVSQWAARYRTFSQRRFVQQSKGGGEWPPLKHGRSRGSKDNALILRDTGLMLGALNPKFINAPGQLQRPLSGSSEIGIRVGFGGSGSYQTGQTVAQVSEWHQIGAGNLPVRRILVNPDARTIAAMEQDAQRAITNIARDLQK